MLSRRFAYLRISVLSLVAVLGVTLLAKPAAGANGRRFCCTNTGCESGTTCNYWFDHFCELKTGLPGTPYNTCWEYMCNEC